MCNTSVVSAGSIRARVRAEMIGEIKAVARRHLATDGANLSLRAVARDMGMVSSALYRYFASRDELLTALIIDAYNDLGDAVDAADAAASDRSDLRGRWLGICHAVRRWALANPAEYALIFGSPVPGYAAPPDTVPAAVRTPSAMLRILADGMRTGVLKPPTAAPLPGASDAVRADFERVREALAFDVPDSLVLTGSASWIHVFGAVSFELFGQLNNAFEAREEYFDLQARMLADLIPLP